MKYCVIIVLCLLVAPLTGCTNPTSSDSQIQSLDNFASATGKITHNICLGPYKLSSKVRITGKDRASLKAAVAALRAIPTSVQDKFFGQFNGVINLRSPKGFSAAACNEPSGGALDNIAKQFYGEGAIVNSCLKWSPRAVQIMMVESPYVIEHNMVRSIAYFYAQQVAPRIFKNWSNSLIGIGRALLADVAASKGKYSIEPYSDLFQSEEGMLRFSEYVFAETFDSFYCNPRTKKVLEESFPRSHEAFARFNNVIRAH